MLKGRGRSLSSYVGTSKFAAPTKKIFSEVIGPQIESLSMEERHRQELIYDFINSERQYLYEISLFYDVFCMTLLNAKVLTKKELTNCFSNFPDLVVSTAKFVEDLEALQKESCVIEKFAESINSREKHFELYKTYSNAFPSLAAHLGQLEDKNPAFVEAAQKIFNKSELLNFSGKGETQYFIYLPIQRINQYPEIIQTIADYTLSDQPDHGPMNQAVVIIKNLVEVVNDELFRGSHIHILAEISSHLEPTPELRTLVKEGRMFLMKAQVGIKFKSKKLQDYEIVICDDIIVIVRRHKVIKVITCHVILIEVIDEENKIVHTALSVELLDKEGKVIDRFLIIVDKIEDKEEIVRSLRKYVSFEEEKKRKERLTTIGPNRSEQGSKAKKVFQGVKQGGTLDLRRVESTSQTSNPANFERSTIGVAGSAIATGSAGTSSTSTPSTAGSTTAAFSGGPGNSAAPRVAAQVIWLSNKVKSLKSTEESLKIQISNILEKKRELEKTLEVLQSGESEIQFARLQNELQLNLTMMMSENMFGRLFYSMLDQVQRDTTIVEKDLERIKKQIEIKGGNPIIEKPKEENDFRHLLNMVCFEEEKAKLLEREESKFVQACKDMVQKMTLEVEQSAKERQELDNELARLRVELQSELERKKRLEEDNGVLRARFQEAKQAVSALPPAELELVREALLRRREQEIEARRLRAIEKQRLREERLLLEAQRHERQLSEQLRKQQNSQNSQNSKKPSLDSDKSSLNKNATKTNPNSNTNNTNNTNSPNISIDTKEANTENTPTPENKQSQENKENKENKGAEDQPSVKATIENDTKESSATTEINKANTLVVVRESPKKGRVITVTASPSPRQMHVPRVQPQPSSPQQTRIADTATVVQGKEATSEAKPKSPRPDPTTTAEPTTLAVESQNSGESTAIDTKEIDAAVSEEAATGNVSNWKESDNKLELEDASGLLTPSSPSTAAAAKPMSQERRRNAMNMLRAAPKKSSGKSAEIALARLRSTEGGLGSPGEGGSDS